MFTQTSLSDNDFAFLLSLDWSDINDGERYSRWLTERDRKSGIRAAARGELRTNITYDNQEEEMNRDTPPDPYALDRPVLQSDLTPDMFPNYSPRGTPPDPYALAAAVKTLNAHDAAPRAATAPKVITKNGVPDPYATALAERGGR